MATRYLLYDAADSEGPSKQRMAGLYFLRRAMELDRVLVLPRCRLLARHRQRTRNHAAAIRLKGDDVYVPFSSLTSALRVVRATEDAVMNVSILTGDGTTTARAGGGVRHRALRTALHAHLELAICSMAPWFLGSATSTFTATILDERVSVFGHDRGTAAHMIGDDAVGFARAPPAAASPASCSTARHRTGCAGRGRST